MSGSRPRSPPSRREPTSSRPPSTRSLSSCTASPASPLAESLEGLGRGTGLDAHKLWDAADVIDEYIGDEPVAPVAPRIAVRAAEYDLPAGLVAALEVHLRAHNAADRLLDVLEEVGRVRAEAGWPPLAAPIGQILASQALLHVLEARRYGTVIDEFRALVQGDYGVTPEPVDPTVERAVDAARAASGGRGRAADRRGRPRAGRGSRRERGGARPHRDVRSGRGGAAPDDPRSSLARSAVLVAEDEDAERAERIRELVKIVQESGVGEIEIEDEGMRVSVRRADEPATAAMPCDRLRGDRRRDRRRPRDRTRRLRGRRRCASSRRWSGSSTALRAPGRLPFVDIGDTVEPGQTLCVLEAMKLFNELKAEVTGVVSSIHVENAQAVEYGQLLFEIEPALAPPRV